VGHNDSKVGNMKAFTSLFLLAAAANAQIFDECPEVTAKADFDEEAVNKLINKTKTS